MSVLLLKDKESPLKSLNWSKIQEIKRLQDEKNQSKNFYLATLNPNNFFDFVFFHAIKVGDLFRCYRRFWIKIDEYHALERKSLAESSNRTYFQNCCKVAVLKKIKKISDNQVKIIS